MVFKVQDSFFDKVPNAVFGVVVVKNFDNTKNYDFINELFKENNYNETFEINYGTNYFPEKIYKGVKYPEGNYESMVIKIGVASGDNYWCVLFPPLCMMEAKETDKVEYKFFIEEIINKYIKNK